MKQFVPYEKLSKKKRRALNAKRRETWSISPVTRRPENPKAYKRKKTRIGDDDSFSVSFLFSEKHPVRPVTSGSSPQRLSQHHAAVEIADRHRKQAFFPAEFPHSPAGARVLGAVHIVDEQCAAR